MNYDNFTLALAAGSVGEQIAVKQLEKLGFTLSDVTKDQSFQQEDIDFVAECGDLRLYVEVKSDSRIADTGNICVETITNKAAKKKGWFYTTKTTHLFFVDIVNKITHVVRTDELRDLTNSKYFRRKETFQNECSLFPKYGEIALIPLAEIQELPNYNKLVMN